MVVKKKQKGTVGLIEEVTLMGKKTIKTHALFDTGARVTSVDIKLASKANLGPILKTQRVKNPSFRQQTMRPVVSAKLKIKGKVFEVLVNIQDRSHMTFPLLIGRNILKGNFIVDVEKNHHIFDEAKDTKTKNEMKNQRRIKHFIDE